MLGLIKHGKVTRTDHGGHSVRTSGPTTTNDLNVDKMKEQLIQQQRFHSSHMPRNSQEAHEMYNEAHKNDSPGTRIPNVLY